MDDTDGRCDKIGEETRRFLVVSSYLSSIRLVRYAHRYALSNMILSLFVSLFISTYLPVIRTKVGASVSFQISVMGAFKRHAASILGIV